MIDARRLQLIEAFTVAWEAKDLDALMDLMADECVFRASIGPEPGESFVGRTEVRRGFAQFLGHTEGPPPETESAVPLVHEDFAVTRWTIRIPQSDGPPLEVRGCDVFEFTGDRIRVKDTYRKMAAALPPVA